MTYFVTGTQNYIMSALCHSDLKKIVKFSYTFREIIFILLKKWKINLTFKYFYFSNFIFFFQYLKFKL